MPGRSGTRPEPSSGNWNRIGRPEPIGMFARLSSSIAILSGVQRRAIRKQVERPAGFVECNCRCPPTDELQQILERADTAYLAYEQGTLWEKRDLVDTLTSNRLVERKSVAITLDSPFDVIANRSECASGDPRRDIPRTWKQLLATLLQVLPSGNRKPNSHSTFPAAA
jgi:hypothetical protein